jgi:transposase-like protein
VYVKINGEMHYLWRAVDQEGEVLGDCQEFRVWAGG